MSKDKNEDRLHPDDPLIAYERKRLLESLAKNLDVSEDEVRKFYCEKCGRFKFKD